MLDEVGEQSMTIEVGPLPIVNREHEPMVGRAALDESERGREELLASHSGFEASARPDKRRQHGPKGMTRVAL